MYIYKLVISGCASAKMLSLDVDQTRIAINNGTIQRAKLVALITRAITRLVHIGRQMQLPVE